MQFRNYGLSRLDWVGWAKSVGLRPLSVDSKESVVCVDQAMDSFFD
jgi:hypothetical protein